MNVRKTTRQRGANGNGPLLSSGPGALSAQCVCDLWSQTENPGRVTQSWLRGGQDDGTAIARSFRRSPPTPRSLGGGCGVPRAAGVGGLPLLESSPLSPHPGPGWPWLFCWGLSQEHRVPGSPLCDERGAPHLRKFKVTVNTELGPALG